MSAETPKVASSALPVHQPVHQPGVFNIEAFVGQRWRGGMNRRTREDAIDMAKIWSSEHGYRHRVFSPEGELVFDSEAEQKVGVLAVIDLQILVGEAAIQAERDESGPNSSAVAVAHGVNVQRLRDARFAIAELISIATKFNGFLGGSSVPDNLTTHRIDVKAMDFYRLQEALKRAGGAA